VVTVGCHDGEYYRNDPGRCALYSGRGAAEGGVRKPDLVAPGTAILSCNAGYFKSRGAVREAYTAKSGTSMATPIVSAAAALALQKYPYMTNEMCRQKLQFSAKDLGLPWNQQGWGMVNVRRLLE
jgi:serine protease AprX